MRRFPALPPLLAVLLWALAASSARCQTLDLRFVDAATGLALPKVQVWVAATRVAVADSQGLVQGLTPWDEGTRVRFLLPGYTQKTWSGPPPPSGSIIALEPLVLEAQTVEITQARTPTAQLPVVAQTLSPAETANLGQLGFMEDSLKGVGMLAGVSSPQGIAPSPLATRGGTADELLLDWEGAAVLSPYQLSFSSVFDPHLVATATLETGVASARYGNFLSGHLSLGNRNVETDRPWEASLSSTGANAVARFGTPAARLAVGVKSTWLDLPLALAGQKPYFDTFPTIRDATVTANLRPTDTWKLSAFVLAGWEAMEQISFGGLEVAPSPVVRWNATTTFASLRSLAYLTPVLSVDNSVSWNTRNWTTHQGDPVAGWAYEEREDLVGLDQRNEVAWEPAAGQRLTLGLEERWRFDRRYDPRQPEPSLPGYLEVAPYATWAFELPGRVLTGEAGARVDQVVVDWGALRQDKTPVFNPRLALRLPLPWGEGPTALVAGAGLYSLHSAVGSLAASMSLPTTPGLSPDRAWGAELGFETKQPAWDLLWTLWTRQGWNRLYLESLSGPLRLHTDGLARAAGSDLTAKFRWPPVLDGFVTWSWLGAEQFNPGNPGEVPGTVAYTYRPAALAPVGQWYFTANHRFHVVNLVLVAHPVPGFDVSVLSAYSSGTPALPQFAAQWVASARNPDLYDLGVKAQWSHSDDQGSWSFYVAVQDLLWFLSKDKSFGTNAADDVNLHLGLPIPSLGATWAW
jgi:hypothetical protein